MPVLITGRLEIRPFVMDDLEDVHRIMDFEAKMEPQSLDERRLWLEWTIRSYTELQKLYQPPYGDRAVVLRETGELIGACGLVSSVGPFELLPSFKSKQMPAGEARFTTEMGLFWALGSAFRGHGYATEAARAVIAFAFRDLNMARLIAATEYENRASQNVMRRLGMRIETNPNADPEWFQVIGVIDHPASGR